MRKGQKYQKYRGQGDTLCWCCKNAVPNVKKGYGCEWSILGQPVKGWEAKPTIIRHGKDYYNDVEFPPIPSFCVRNCPKYEPDQTE